MSFTLSPNMNLVIPGVGTEAGPQYATDINSSLTIIDQHNHSAGSGVQITPSGLNINASLPLNNNYLTGTAAVTLVSQSISPANGSVYQQSGNLYWFNGAGAPVQITSGNSVLGSSGTIGGLPSGTASANYNSITGTFVFQSATNVAANIDGGSFVLRNNTSLSKGLTLQPPNAMGSDYSITLPSLPAQTNVMTLDTSGNMGSITYDQVGQNMTSVGANAIASTMTSTGADAIAATMTSTGADAIAATRTRPVAGTVGTGGIAKSNGSGSFSTTSSSFVIVTNLVVTITTSGRPLMVTLVPFNTGTTTNVSSAYPFSLAFVNNGVTSYQVDPSAGAYPAGAFTFIDTNVATGTGSTYQYQIQVKTNGPGGSSVQVNNCALVVYEL